MFEICWLPNRKYLEIGKSYQDKKCIKIALRLDIKDAKFFDFSHIILVLDSSGSMTSKLSSGKKRIEALSEIASSVVDKVSDNNFLTVVKYNDIACNLVNSVLINSSTRGKVKNEVENIVKNAHGCTNFEKVLQELDHINEKISNKDLKNPRVLLISDGENTAGDPEKALEISKKLASSGISIDTMGVGSDDETFVGYLQDIAKLSAGKYHPVMNSENAMLQGIEEFVKTSKKIVMKNVKGYFEFANEVIPGDFYRLKPERNYIGKIAGNNKKHDFYPVQIEKGENYIYFLELHIPPIQEEKKFEAANLHLEYETPNGNNKINKSLIMEVTTDIKKNKLRIIDISRAADIAKISKLTYHYDKLRKEISKEEKIKYLGEIINLAKRCDDKETVNQYHKELENIKGEKIDIETYVGAISSTTKTQAVPINIFKKRNFDDFFKE